MEKNFCWVFGNHLLMMEESMSVEANSKSQSHSTHRLMSPFIVSCVTEKKVSWRRRRGFPCSSFWKNNVIDTWQSAQEQSISCSLSPSLAFFPCFPWPIRWFPSISPPTPVLSPCNPRSRHEEGKPKIAFPSFFMSHSHFTFLLYSNSLSSFF